MPSASEDAVNLIASCYYVPPFLRTKLPIAGTPPPAGTKNLLLEQQTAKKYGGALSDSRIAGSLSSPKVPALLSAGVQRKLDLMNQDANKNDKIMKSTIRQPVYRPPVRNSPSSSMNKGNNVGGVSDMGDQLENMTSVSRKASMVQLARPMKAGVRWNSSSSSDLLVRAAQEIQPGSYYYPRKVAG